MGLFTKNQENRSKNVYNEEVQQYIAEKDGFQHVIMIESFSKFGNMNFGVEDKYTTQLDHILTAMQRDGYEIINVEHTTVKGQGTLEVMEGFHTLITYK